MLARHSLRNWNLIKQVQIGSNLFKLDKTCPDLIEFVFLQGWSVAYTVETTIIQLTATLVDGKARINFSMSPQTKYTLEGAEWSFKRLVGIHEKVGWQKNNDS